MNLPDVICLYAPKQSGKTTAADILVNEYDYTPIGFADAVRDGVAASFGFDPEWFRKVSSDPATKELPMTQLYGRTPRSLLIQHGTAFYRDGVNSDHWLEVGKRKIADVLASRGRVVITDARFANEAQGVKDAFGAVVVGIQRDSTWLPDADNGPAEAAVYDGWYRVVDRTITNDGTLAEFEDAVRTRMERSRWYRWRKGERCFVDTLGPGRITTPERDHMIDVKLDTGRTGTYFFAEVRHV